MDKGCQRHGSTGHLNNRLWKQKRPKRNESCAVCGGFEILLRQWSSFSRNECADRRECKRGIQHNYKEDS